MRDKDIVFVSTAPAVEFSGGSVLNMLVCKSQPSTGRLTVGLDIGIIVVNSLTGSGIVSEPVEILIQRLDPDLPLPAYAHPGDAGADLVGRPHRVHLLEVAVDAVRGRECGHGAGAQDAAGESHADLISIGAQLHADGGTPRPAPSGEALWLASTLAIATGEAAGLEEAKFALRAGNPGAEEAVRAAAIAIASAAGLADALADASQAIE